MSEREGRAFCSPSCALSMVIMNVTKARVVSALRISSLPAEGSSGGRQPRLNSAPQVVIVPPGSLASIHVDSDRPSLPSSHERPVASAKVNHTVDLPPLSTSIR